MKILSETIKAVINSGSDIVLYKQPISYGSFTYYSEEDKVEFIIKQIHDVYKNYDYIKWSDINMPKKININKLFFHDTQIILKKYLPIALMMKLKNTKNKFTNTI